MEEIAALLEDVRRWDGGRERVKWWCPAGAHTFTPAGGACTAKWVGHASTVRAVAWSPDGKTVCSEDLGREKRVWNSETGECLFSGKKLDAKWTE